MSFILIENKSFNPIFNSCIKDKDKKKNVSKFLFIEIIFKELLA